MDFSTLLILDCKTALWENSKETPAGQTNEITCIDIAVVDTAKNEIVDHEIIYVKPKKAKISAYCEKIFSLSQAKIDADGVPFEQAYRRLRVHYMSRDRLWGSWGRYEKYSLDKQCKWSELENLFTTSHLDVQHLYALMIGLNNESNCITIEEALKHTDIRSTDNNAYNTASVYMRMAKGLRPTVKTRIVVPAHQYKNVN